MSALPPKADIPRRPGTVLGSSGIDYRPLAHLAAIEHHPSRGLNAFSQIVERLRQFLERLHFTKSAKAS
jgi:hypothetical protein